MLFGKSLLCLLAHAGVFSLPFPQRLQYIPEQGIEFLRASEEVGVMSR
jgi:hypothetical protein